MARVETTNIEPARAEAGAGSSSDDERGSSVASKAASGLIGGAANDDPVAITTYLQVGAAHGYGLLWLTLLCFPLMWLVHEVGSRIGRTTGRGLTASMADIAPRPVMLGCVALLAVANTLQIAADLAMIGEVVAAISPLPSLLVIVTVAVLSALLQLFADYPRYVRILQWTALSLLSYVAATLMVGVSWSEAALALWPRIAFTEAYLVAVVGIIGVALSPYVLFWQSNQEAEDQRLAPGRQPLLHAPHQADRALSRIRIGSSVAMAAATLVAAAILLTSAATLHAQGTTTITSISEAARALEPAAGPFATLIFAIGVIGTGLLAIPVLAGSAAYAVGEALGRRVGLGRKVGSAKLFYGTIAGLTSAATGIALLGIDPLRIVTWSATLNGIVVVPVLLMMTLIAGRRDAMGRFAAGKALLAASIGMVLLTGAAVLALALVSQL